MSSIYQRWGRELGSTQKWAILKNRLKAALGSRDLGATEVQVQHLAFVLGRDIREIASEDGFGYEWYIRIGDLLDEASDGFELANIMEALFASGVKINISSEAMANIINNANCGIRFKLSSEGWQSYPAGEQLLDAKLIDRPLSFLEGASLSEYSKALDHYASGKWEECAEKTRRSLEEYLRTRLQNNAGLAANIEHLAKEWGKSDLPTHFRTTLTGIMKILDKNFNESSKHNSKTYGEVECELLLYQTGLIMLAIDKTKSRG